MTDQIFGGFAPGSEYQVGITWVDPVVLNFSNMKVNASTKYNDTTFHIHNISNAVADPAADMVITNAVDNEANIYFSADENYTSYAKNWRMSGTVTREAKAGANLFTAFAVQDTTGKTQWFCVVGKTLVRMRTFNWDESTRAVADGTTIIENQAASDFNWSNADGSRALNFTVLVENDTLKAYFGSNTQPMKLAWNLPLTEEVNGSFASGSAYRLVMGTTTTSGKPFSTTVSNIRVDTQNVVNISKTAATKDNLPVRDPFILEDNGVYYLYGTSSFGRLDVYTSTDLYQWTKENACFVAYGDFFGNAVVFSDVSGKEKASWAPEVYKYDGAYYMLATFTQDTETMNQQATVMLKADSPLGPFEMWSDGPVTPAGHSCLDATLYFENGIPYLIYAHEWQCSCRNYKGTGSMDYAQLTTDLKAITGTTKQWFGANELTNFWDNITGTSSSRTTDGPFVYTDVNGQNYLLWSTHLDPSDGNTYAQLATKFTTLGSSLNLKRDSIKLQEDNGGHGMIFTDRKGQETLIMHNADNKAAIYNVVLNESSISLTEKSVTRDYVAGWSLQLKDQIGVNFYLDLNAEQVATTKVSFLVDGVSTVISGSQLTEKDGRYVASLGLAAAQMTSSIVMELTVGENVQTATYTVKQIAQKVLDEQQGQYTVFEKELVQAMLHYGAQAQRYFAHNTNNLANAGYEITDLAQIPESFNQNVAASGSIPNVYFHGATLLMRSHLAVRYYFSGDLQNHTAQIDGTATSLQQADNGLWYVDVENILPQEMDKNYTVTIIDGQNNTLAVTYGPMFYIARKSGTEKMQDLVQALYHYHVKTCDYLYNSNTSDGIQITTGYETTDTYAVLTANIKSNSDLVYGWKNTIALGVSGKTYWSNYGFQLAYGNSADQNLVKLNNGKGYDNKDVMQEQWYNNAKLEALFADGGMDIKLVRMNTRAFLMADMGEGYELIGTMMVPGDVPTNFNVCSNSNTQVQVTNISVQTGKEATVAALNGIDLSLTKTPHIFPVNSDTWTVEGRLTVDMNNLPTSDYRLFAGTDGFSQAVAVLSVGGSATNWRVQNQKKWNSYVLDASYYNLLDQNNGGMWVRWIRSGNNLTLWVSADGNNWQQTVSHTDLTNNDLYILANQNLGAQLTDLRISTEAVFTQQKKANTFFAPGDYTNANYAVFEGNIKALDALTYDWSSNLIMSVSGDAKWDKYDFQMLYGTSSSRNLVKLTNNTAGTVDGITVTQDQNINKPAFEKPFTEEGMNIKVVRLNTWAYLLADMGNGYEMIGKMYIPADQATRFGVYNNNTAIEISNYSVKTGEDAALAALDGINLKVDQLANAFAVPVSTTQWTLEGKVLIPDFAAGADYRFTVSSNKSDWKRMTLAYINSQSKWRGQSIAQLSGSWASTDLPNGNSLASDGLWTRWVRDGATLCLYVSTDRETWTYVQNCDSCGENAGIIYIFEANGDFNPVMTNLTIYTGLPQ